ncbi:major allergen Pru ar 1-like [Rhodamnia argentea]|uniref:Major allergen Pru ar 1-like n=1 Tax=Rhodamnia argentea TaxID=178133 RepID=A0A8B8QGB5_9MYRT|nr:major allergen Pru ar 1-like [Rhodamnia argentea]
MGLITYDMEVVTPIPPTRMFKAFVFDSDKIFPKILPHAFESIEVIEGDGGPGTIKKITFGEASHFKYAKHRVDAPDQEKLTYSYGWIEGDALMNIFEKISYDIKIEAGPEGGSICKNRSKYYATGDIQFTEEQIKEGKEKVLGLFKALEGYLLANPNAC